jgi:hypothetical protein
MTRFIQAEAQVTAKEKRLNDPLVRIRLDIEAAAL